MYGTENMFNWLVESYTTIIKTNIGIINHKNIAYKPIWQKMIYRQFKNASYCNPILNYTIIITLVRQWKIEYTYSTMCVTNQIFICRLHPSCNMRHPFTEGSYKDSLCNLWYLFYVGYILWGM